MGFRNQGGRRLMKRFQQSPQRGGQTLTYGEKRVGLLDSRPVVRVLLLRVGWRLRREVVLLVTFRNSEGKRAFGAWSGGGAAGSHLQKHAMWP